MGRSPCCLKEGLNRGAWTAQEDKILRDYITIHGQGKWRNLPQRAGLKRCGKSCRLRWLNYLRPDIKRGNISPDEEELIIRLHKLLGNRWSLIAGRLPGRTDNEIKNYWNTNLCKKVNTGGTNSSSSQQQIENNNNNNMMEEAKGTSTTPSPSSLSPNNSKYHNHSLLIHTKASKCSDNLLLVDPLPLHLSPPTEPMLLIVDDKNIIPRNDDDDRHREEDLLSTDLLLDFEIGDICLPHLLNSDFGDLFDFGYKNNDDDGKDLFPLSEQLLVSSNDGVLKLKDSTSQSNFCDEETNDVVVDYNFCDEDWSLKE